MKQKGINSFSGKRIWIIGASSGIGEACAKSLINQNARVILSSRRVERLNVIAQDAKVDQVLVIPLDVTNDEQLATAYEKIINSWGGIDLLLFVSGIYTPLRADNFDIHVAEQTIDANLLGPMKAVALVLPKMLQAQRGNIAIVGSVAGYSGLPKALAYGPSKAAQINFLESLRTDLRDTNVIVQTVSPGFVKTPMTDVNTFPMPFIINAERAAKIIVKGIEKESAEIIFPTPMAIAMKLSRLVPASIWPKLFKKG